MSIIKTLLPNFKDVLTSRGLNYHYYFSAPIPGKPTLLLIHGFPSFAIDWHYQIAYFKKRGYGLVVPDQLGYGSTDKPAEAQAYVYSLLAKDLVDVLDHEKVTDVVAIGHDWGSKTTSVLAQLYPDRFIGFGFLAVGYIPPSPEWDKNALRELSIKTIGYENIGYWEFFTAPDANSVIKEHIESFLDILYAKDSRLWLHNMCPTGAIRIFIESDTRTPRVSSIAQEFWDTYKKEFSKHGIDGPLNYYRVASTDLEKEDAKQIPLENYKIQKPVFFGGASGDMICVETVQELQTRQFCPNTTSQSFKATHWVAKDAAEEVNEALERWINMVVLG